MTPKVPVQVGVKSHVGLVREENQDRMTQFGSVFGEVFVVADGMGGHLGGATAATAVVKGVQEYLTAAPPEQPLTEALTEATRRVNQEVFQAGNAGDPAVAGMGSTMVIAVVTPQSDLIVAHVGDSRAYLFRNRALRRLTRDHTRVQQYVDAGMMSEAEARVHPEASFLSRAIGQRPEVEPEFLPPIRLQAGDLALLCSDGLCGYIDDPVIEQTLQRTGSSPQEAVGALIDLALKAGGEDNVTVQLIQPMNAAPAPPVPGEPAPVARKKRITKPLAIGIAVLAVGALAAVRQYRVSNRATKSTAAPLTVQVEGTPRKASGPEGVTPTTAPTGPGAAIPREATTPRKEGAGNPHPAASAAAVAASPGAAAAVPTSPPVLPAPEPSAAAPPPIEGGPPPGAPADPAAETTKVIVLYLKDQAVARQFRDDFRQLLGDEPSVEETKAAASQQKMFTKSTVVAWKRSRDQAAAGKIASTFSEVSMRKQSDKEAKTFPSAGVLVILGTGARPK